MVLLVNQDQWEPLETLVLQDLKDQAVPQALQGHQGPQETQDNQVLTVSLVSQDRRELMVCQEQVVLRDSLVLQDLQGLTVTTALQGL